jgi:tetratricopeptide (TPR) repeat protein
MTRTLVVTVLLAIAAAAGAVLYHTAARQQQYQVLMARGDVAARNAQTFGAIEAYSGAIGLRPDSMLAHLRRGEIYQQRGELEAAAADFRRAATLDTAATRPLEALGDVQLELAWFARAAEAYRSNLELDDRSARVTYKLALARYRTGDLPGAMTELTKAIALDDQMADAYYLLGMCLRERNQASAALEAFERAVTLSPALIAAREEIADLHVAAGRHADAIDQLQVIAGLDRARIERQVALGLAQARAGQGEVAVLTLANALDRAPDQTSIYTALGRVWLDMAAARSDALGKALEALQRAAAAPAASSEALTLYGRALIRANDLDAAEKILRQAIQRYPVEPAAYLYYAGVSERLNHLDQARTALIQYGALVEEERDYAARATTIGSLSLRLDDAATAVAWLERAAAVRPDDSRVQGMLAEARLRSRDAIGGTETVLRNDRGAPANGSTGSLDRSNPATRHREN